MSGKKKAAVLAALKRLDPCPWSGTDGREEWRREVQVMLDRERLRNLESKR